MRLNLLVNFYTYDNSAPTNDPASQTSVKNSLDVDGITEVSRFQSSIADGTTDQVIALPSSPTSYLLILTDGTISVKLNSSVTAQTLKPTATGKKTIVLVQKGDITGLKVSNASGAAINIDVILAE